MKKISRTITGKIIDKKTEKGLSNLRIEACDKNAPNTSFAESSTNEEGMFTISVNPSSLKDKKPDLIFKIYSGDKLLQTAPLDGKSNGRSEIVIPIEMPGPAADPRQVTGDDQWRVMGRVTKANGEGVEAIVSAFNKRLNGEQSLGQVSTRNGTYIISYPSPLTNTKVPGCKRPDLIVRAYKNDELIASSEVIYNAGKITAVDLVVGNENYKGPSEYNQLEQTIRHCLGEQDPATLTIENVEYLSNKTGTDKEWLTLYVLAQRQSKITNAYPPLFYACYRNDLPLALNKLSALEPAVISSRIKNAIKRNIIDPKWNTEIDNFLMLLGQSAVESALVIDKDSSRTSLGKIFTLIKIPAEPQRALLQLYLKHKNDIPGFWNALDGHKTLGKFAANLRLALKVSALTQHYDPATRAILELPLFSQKAEISMLTRLTSAEWAQLTKSIGSAPENIPGDGKQKLENYARLMEKTIVSAFPTQHIATNIARNKKYQNTELPKFFEAAPDFSFKGTNIPVYVNKLNGSITDKNAVIKDLSRLQRLYYLAPSDDKYNVIEVLDNQGVASALQVRQYGKKAFINSFSQMLGSQTVASQIFSKASYIGATTMNIAMQYQDLNTSVLPYVLQGTASINTAEELHLPDLSALFGGQSFCSCEHCRSVYSAAAYLVDLLSYLKEHYAIDQDASTPTDTVYKEGVTGLTLFFKRRSDIGNIILNCENTDTLIPYIDIVNEVLENAVVSSSEAYQTTSTSDELKANPEHINKAAYDDILVKEIFPFSQPFNLWNEEGSVYMEHLGIARYQLMDAFQCKTSPNEPDDKAKYTVQLNLTESSHKIITGESIIDSVPRATKDFWGVTDTKWREILSNVSTFIDKAEITYEQLLQFLQVKYINPDGTIKIQFEEDAPCDIEQATLSYWDEATQTFSTEKIKGGFFADAHRFFRLLRKTSWPILELGKVMSSLNSSEIDDTFVEQVAILLQVQSEHNIELPELLSWWATLNTQSDQYNEDDRSFYAQNFLNKTVFDPKQINEGTFVFTLNSSGTELNVTGNKISDYLNEIAAALNIDSSELLLLTETLRTSSGDVNDELTLANLSQLFRMASLAKAMDITVEDYLIAISFISSNPFDKANPKQLKDFISQINQVKESAFSFLELQYLLLDIYNPTESIAPSEEKIITLLTSLQEGLMKIRTEHEVPLDEDGIPVDPTGEICKQKLALILEVGNIDAVVSIVQATEGLSQQNEEDAAAYLSFMDVSQLITDFSASGSYRTVESRYAYILKALVDYLTSSQSRSFVIQTFSNDLSIDLVVSELLLTELVLSTDTAHSSGSDRYAIEDFLIPDFAYDELEEEEVFDLTKFSVQKNTYIVLFKSAMLINKFSLEAEEVSWTFTKGPQIGWLDPNLISGTAADLFWSWGKMDNFFHLHKNLPEGDTSLFDLLDYAADPSLLESLETGYDEEVDAFIADSTTWTVADKSFLIFLSLLSEITAWETESLFYLASSKAYALNFNDFKDEQAFYQLMKCFDILHILGASAEDAWTWMTTDLTSENASNIKQTIKSKYTETEWLTVAQPLRDVLREKQRDALTAYLIQNRNFEDENALYEYYLLDVEMGACMMTSRIVLANSSVQLFVQRCLMNLEDEILDLDVDRWEWMKNYRVWEANRKVFLYPENWIEPELRMVKSEFFTELQNALLQNDVSADQVETSLNNYLEKLDAISNIEVCGTYYQYELGEGATPEEIDDNTINVLHVFGKTTGIPHEYYYRTYIDDSYWTPWEKISLDIQGDHLMPIVLNRRLYLFWPDFTSSQMEVTAVFSDSTLAGFAERALEEKYSMYYSSYPTYDELVDEYGQTTADILDQMGVTQEKQRSIYINAESIQQYQDEISGASIDYFNIKLAYSEYKQGKWLPKKLSSDALSSDTFWRATDIANGFESTTGNILETICFHSSVKSTYLEISCTQKINVQSSGSLFWNDRGHFKFYFDKKDIIAEDTLVIYSVMEPTGTSVYFNSFKEESSSKLELITADVTTGGNFEGNETYETVLDMTPGTFRIPIPHQYDQFVSQTDFFYGDDYRSFFVKPYRSVGIEDAVYTSSNGLIAKSNIDHLLTGQFIEVGLFNETLYTKEETSIILSGQQLAGFGIDHPVLTEQIVAQRPVSNLLQANGNGGADTKTRVESPGRFEVNQQAYQLEYLGDQKYRFINFYHPYINDFIKSINRDGVEGLLTREMQLQLVEYFNETYLPTEKVHTDYPVKEVDFSTEGALSIYNWELFFHIPMLIADRLSKNQQFEDAQRWYHFIFNPTDRSSEASPNKFWQFKNFFELYEEGEGAAEDSIYNLMYALSYTGTDIDILNKKAEVEKQVDAWLKSPFDPHAIAALRPVAYMKSIVMKYLDNLIAWGDFKFQQDSIESINEATQVYILAAQILGKRPELIAVEETKEMTYNELVLEAGELDAFSNALVTLENIYDSETLFTGTSSNEAEFLPKSLYFCIPNNPNLLAYWDTVEDRLFKIRHCMNIEGIVRQLPLFQPPIDPAMLIKARAAGLDIGSVLNDLYAPLPQYRYRIILQKAFEFCADVKSLGSALLNVLEKRDAEEFAMLRASHESKLLEMMTDLKQLQLDESRENLSAFKTLRKVTEARFDFYSKIEKLSTSEQLQLDMLKIAHTIQAIDGVYHLAASVAHMLPETSVGLNSGITFGGGNLGDSLADFGKVTQSATNILTNKAYAASIKGSFDRRWDDWKLQEKLASRELENIDKQIVASEIRVAIMEKEIENHKVQLENNQAVNEFMTNKFTNTELYNWMSGQLSTVYFQSYQMAYDMGKKAQRCFQYELGSDQTFIEFGYWDSLKKGLLAGEKLHYDLKRMEVAYIDQTKRTYELTKSVSLAMFDPLALVQLRETGTCYINLPEALFDLDYPGHYMRRIKSVQLTLPCVAGPYTSVNCKVTLLDNKWRKDSSGTTYAETIDDYDSRFVYNTGGNQSIATSSGQNDSGIFQLNFNDERYLPFEGAGAISNWRLELPSEMRSFDYNTLSDVIMQISYTAKEGGDVLKEKASSELQNALMSMALGSENTSLTRMFSTRHEFANEWYRFLNPPADQEGQHITLALDNTRFPYMFRKFDILIATAEIILILEDTTAAEAMTLNVAPSGGSATMIDLNVNAGLGGQLSGKLESISAGTGEWQINVDEASIPAGLKVALGDHVRLNTDIIKNMILIVSYGISE